ncbi:MAG: TatD family hydrolase, partial [Fimbriimonas ginsengisoli]|nr:TatD family hydrolase [Fimbriimonas ginsengisoli]
MLIDTHCHLNFPDAFPDPAAEIEAARVAGVEALVVVGIDLESSEAALRLADSFEEVHAVVGMHPNTAGEAPEGWLSQLEARARRPKAVAIGEIGLDFHWKDTPPDMQMQALLAQLDLAARLDKPIVFHCREAYDELLTVLEARGSGRYLFHCFSGDLDHARRALA